MAGGMGQMAGMVGGMGFSLLGTGLSALAAEDRKKEIEKLRQSPIFQPISVETETAKTIAGNQRNLAAAAGLAKSVDIASQDEWTRALKASMPEAEGILDTMRKNTESLTDFDRLIGEAQRRGAAFGVSSGTLGSGFNKAFTARQFGLDYSKMLQAQNQSYNQYLQMASSLKRAPMFDMTRMFYTPDQALAQANQNQQFAAGLDFGIAQMPGAMDVWGSGLTSMGGAMMGASSGMGGGGQRPQQQGGGMGGSMMGGWPGMFGGGMTGMGF